VVATIAPQPAFAKADVFNEESINFAVPPSPAKSGVSQRSNQKIAMVTNVLKDILQSAVNDEAQETAIFKKYMNWCKSERDGIAKDTSESSKELANAEVLSEEQLSEIDSFELFLTRGGEESEKTKNSIAQAVSLRNDENDQYTEDMQMNTQSLSQIESAIRHVGKVQKQGGFLQNGVVRKFQINQPGESSYVFGIMKGLKEKLERSRVSLIKTEKEKVSMHNSFMGTKGKSLKALVDTTTTKKIQLTETSAKQSGVKRKIGKLTDELSNLQEAASRTNGTCQSTQQEWKSRQADRIKEKAALTEAIRYLAATSFQQLSQVQMGTESGNGEDDASVALSPSLLQVAGVLQTGDREFDSAVRRMVAGDDSEDAEVVHHMQDGSFNGVKSVVAKLISSHQDTQTEEKSKRAYCEREMAIKEDEGDEAATTLAAVKADIDKKTSEAAMLAGEVKKLYASIAQVRKSLGEASNVRKQELVVFEAGSKDRTLAMKVLKQAKAVLQHFYEKANGQLLQKVGGAYARSPPPSKWSTGSPRKEASSFAAVSMVQEIADDIAKEQKDAAIQETQSLATFAELQEDSQQAMDDKQQDITDRVTAKAKLGVQINGLKETRTEKSDDVSGISQQLRSLHKECDELLHFYDKRNKARSFEVSQLRDVMDILSGSALAARTGLVQVDDPA